MNIEKLKLEGLNRRLMYYNLNENYLELEKTLNNIPGVLENGLFVNVATLILVGEVKDGKTVIREL